MYIGLSMSNCVRDILKERVKVDDVAFIITGALVGNEFDTYRGTYWAEFSDYEIINLLKTLYLSGKIFQPRVLQANACKLAEGWWVKITPEEIQAMFELLVDKPRVMLY